VLLPCKFETEVPGRSVHIAIAHVACAKPVCGVGNPTWKIRKAHYILLMMMEDAMTRADKLMQCAAPVVAARHLDSLDSHSLYVLLVSLLGTVISLPAVWYLTAAAYAAPGLVA
jgi:hypothetical protein